MPLYTVELHTSTVTTLESNYSIETEHYQWRCLERNIRNDLEGWVVEVDVVGLLRFVPCFLTGRIFMQDDGRTSCIPSPPHHHHRHLAMFEEICLVCRWHVDDTSWRCTAWFPQRFPDEHTAATHVSAHTGAVHARHNNDDRDDDDDKDDEGEDADTDEDEDNSEDADANTNSELESTRPTDTTPDDDGDGDGDDVIVATMPTSGRGLCGEARRVVATRMGDVRLTCAQHSRCRVGTPILREPLQNPCSRRYGCDPLKDLDPLCGSGFLSGSGPGRANSTRR